MLEADEPIGSVQCYAAFIKLNLKGRKVGFLDPTNCPTLPAMMGGRAMVAWLRRPWIMVGGRRWWAA